jgi:hypothetical protein
VGLIPGKKSFSAVRLRPGQFAFWLFWKNSMRDFAQRQPQATKLLLAAVQRPHVAAVESTQHKHPVLRAQHSLGNRATRQILLSGRELEARKLLALAPDKPGGPAPAAAETADQSHVPTNWFLDFWGVGNGGHQKGRGDRQEGDVAVVNHLIVGPKDESREFELAGVALSSGFSRLGALNHRKGRGSASGSVSYAQRKDIEAKLVFSEKADKKVLAAAKAAAQKKVEELIFHNTDVSGNWSEVERQAASAAAEHLPEGSDAKVEIALKGQHHQVPLDTVDYDVHNPSLCTAKITVPTTTQSVGWSRTDTQESAQKNQSASVDKTHVEVDVGGSQSHTQTRSHSDVEGKADSRTDTSQQHHATRTHTETEYGIGWADIDASSKLIADHIVTTLGSSWLTVTNQLYDKKDGGAVPGATGPEPSTGDKIKGWLKDKAKQAIGWAKDTVINKAKDFLKSKIKGYILKAIDIDAPWFYLLDWGFDYLVDKLQSKASATKSPDQTAKPSSTQVGTAIKNVSQITSGQLTAVQQDTYNELQGYFRKVYDKDEESITDKGSTHSSGSASVKASGGSSSDTEAGHADVKTTTDSQKSKEGSQEEHTGTSRTYYGTTVSVIAGHPVLQVTVEDKT